jgi:hypothetical protein
VSEAPRRSLRLAPGSHALQLHDLVGVFAEAAKLSERGLLRCEERPLLSRHLHHAFQVARRIVVARSVSDQIKPMLNLLHDFADNNILILEFDKKIFQLALSLVVSLYERFGSM